MGATRTFTLNIIASVILLTWVQNSSAREVFNYRLLESGASESELEALKHFSDNNGLVPGKYRVDVYMNNQHIARRDITFVFDTKSQKLLPLLTKKDYVSMGVNSKASATFLALSDDATVENIENFIPSSSVQFQQDSLRLSLSVPQIAMNSSAAGFIDPQLWDNGLPMIFTNYYFNGAQNWQDDNNENDKYLSLSNGANLGPWRLRNDLNYSDGHWQNVDTYLWRNISALTSKLTMGDSWTGSDVFDSFQFRGIKLESNDNMLPYSMRGFAPVIRGVARTNAQVTIRQNNYVIYQSYVSPGPFELHDVSPITSGGDMEVTVKESDGSEQTYIQASASVPIMRRQGSMSYSLVGGKYRSSDSNADEPKFIQGTLIYGLPWGITLYGGTIGAQNYRSGALGTGLDLQQLGSLSADITWSQTNLVDQENQSGQSYRVQYSKNFTPTDTNLTLAGYRYSTRNYYTFNEALNQQQYDDDDPFSYRYSYARHRRLQITVSQAIPSFGQLYLSGYQQDYWGLGGKERSLSVGYSYTWNSISFNASYLLTKMPDNAGSDQQFSLSMSIPLDKWLPGAHISYSNNSSNDGRSLNSVALNGTALKDNNLSYSLQQSHGNQGQGYGGNASMSYRSSKGTVNGGWSYDNDRQRLNYGLQGAVVLHPYGVTLAQSLGDASILVRAPNTEGLGVNRGTAIYTDWRGYSIVPYASAFQRNRVAINSQTLPPDAEVQDPVQEVIPTEGAMVVANFSPRLGQRMLLTLTHAGKAVPFGAVVTSDDGQFSTLVGQNGQTYLSGTQANQTWLVKWGKSANQSCRIVLSPDLFSDNASHLLITSLHCG
ncbi:fimbrial biogenesis outer membrane usher protein [Citrobacter portucalensis]|uniref:fimbria/pilus outer membrane usher protein n=1 Tax=Citrobacter TaxID=544 RepID=UPI0025769E39|nr:fimbria/pilus outer membrane usher protein [Citrobacter sp. Cpo090]MDM2842886.1 fimbrial biogenesis outer membrane usher protein [Citrobacter sp. Cpo090]